MPSGVYSRRLLYVEGAGRQVDFVVPPKKRCVVRSVIARAQDPGGGAIFVGLHGIWCWAARLPEQYDALNEEFYAVVYENETVGILTQGLATMAYVTGYLFDDPEGKPPSTKPTDPARPSVPLPVPQWRPAS